MCFALIRFPFWQLVLCEIKSPLMRINFRYLTFHCLYCNYVFVFENSVRTQLACREGSEAHLSLLLPVVFEL